MLARIHEVGSRRALACVILGWRPAMPRSAGIKTQLLIVECISRREQNFIRERRPMPITTATLQCARCSSAINCESSTLASAHACLQLYFIGQRHAVLNLQTGAVFCARIALQVGGICAYSVRLHSIQDRQKLLEVEFYSLGVFLTVRWKKMEKPVFKKKMLFMFAVSLQTNIRVLRPF